MNNKKRVLIVLENTGRGGAETQALNLCSGLISNDFEVHLLSFGSKRGTYWDNFSELGVTLHLTGFDFKLLLSPKGIKGKFFQWRSTVQLVQLVRKIKPDSILPFTYPPNIILTHLWKFTGAKACYWNQRDEGRLFKGSKNEIKALKGCTQILSNSLEGALFLKKYTDREITIIHNGVVFPEKCIDYVVPEKVRVVMVANLHRYKDHDTLLKAWELVVQEKGKNSIELLLAGKERNSTKGIKEFIESHNLTNSVHCLGEVTNIPDLLLTCHVGVFSSVKEGLPNGILECMAVGLPVVATKINGAIEALGEDSEFLANPHDAHSLAQKLLLLLNDAALREQIGSMNRQRIKKDFAMKKMVNEYISILNN